MDEAASGVDDAAFWQLIADTRAAIGNDTVGGSPDLPGVRLLVEPVADPSEVNNLMRRKSAEALLEQLGLAP
jgi:hypothetical protein